MNDADQAMATDIRRIMDSAARARKRVQDSARHIETMKRVIQVRQMVARYFDAKVGKR